MEAVGLGRGRRVLLLLLLLLGLWRLRRLRLRLSRHKGWGQDEASVRTPGRPPDLLLLYLRLLLLLLLLAVAERVADAAEAPVAESVQEAAERQRDVAEEGGEEAHVQLVLTVVYVCFVCVVWSVRLTVVIEAESFQVVLTRAS